MVPAGCLAEGEPVRGVVTRALGVGGCLELETEGRGFGEVMCDVGTPSRRSRVRSLEWLLLDDPGDLPVQVLALGGWNRGVDRVANHGVREQVTVDLVVVLHEQASRESFLERFERDAFRHLADDRERIDGEVATDCGGGADHSVRVLGEPFEATIYQRPHAGGRNRGDRLRELGRALELHELLVELAEQLAQEEGIPPGRVVQRDGELHQRGHRLGRTGRAHERAHLVVVESRQVDLAPLARSCESSDEVGPLAVDLVVAERGDHEHAVELRVAHEVTDEPQRRPIRPVQVFDYEHSRLGNERGHRRGDRLEQAELRALAVRIVVGVGSRLDEVGKDQRQRGGERRTAAGIERLDERSQDFDDRLIVGRRLGVAAPDQRSSSEMLRASAEFLDERRLADAGGARHEDQLGRPARRRVQRSEQGSDLDAPSDEPRDRRAHLCHRLRRPSQRYEVEAGPLEEHVFFESSQLGRRRDSQVFVETPREVGIGAQRLGLAPTSIQTENQAGGETFAERELFERRADEVDRQRVLPEREARVGEVLDGDGAEVVEPSDLGAGRGDVAHVPQRRTPPQIERLGQLRHRARRITGHDRLSGQDHEPLESLRVELIGLDAQHVAVRPGGQSGAGRVRVAIELEGLAEPADVHAQRGGGTRRRVALPELLHELFGADRAIWANREECKELAGFFAAHLHRRAVVTNLDRTEDS